jgi:predicted branched-subunit amino acid permease
MTPQQKQSLVDGLKEMSRSSVTILTWGFVTGIAMAKSTLTLHQALAMNILVYSGTSQLAALPLIAVGLPIWMILITSFMVNLRFVIFSLGLQAHFSYLSTWRRIFLGYCTADFSYLLYVKRYPKPQTQRELHADQEHLRLHWMMGMQFGNWALWQVGSIIGILLASQIPNNWGLEFAGAIALLVIVVPMLDRSPARWAALTAAVVAVASYGIPFRLNILLAIVAALIVGMMMDKSPKGSAPYAD